MLAVIASMAVAAMAQKDSGEAEAEYNGMSEYEIGILLASLFNFSSLISKVRVHDHMILRIFFQVAPCLCLGWP